MRKLPSKRFHKSSLFISSSIAQEVRDDIMRDFNMFAPFGQETCLGLLFITRKKKEVFKCLREKGWQKIKWLAHTLPIQDREQGFTKGCAISCC